MIQKIAIIALVLLNIGCDQVSKNMVRNNIDASEQIELVGKNFILTKVENSGAMLGFGSELSPILKLIFLQALPVLVLLVLLFRILRRSDMNKWLVFAFACVIGGGIGNLIDRIAYGEVTDFFHIDLGGYFKTGIFNMADVSVTMGVILILFLSIRYRKLEL
ncbi:signal peptidase II [Maribacter sp. 2308TA10-17]|uniref:signal peptidase II n=1 Tax=Maribacter sp. 2308TA10-17 TaxID=3386276 RepID=UPI0039BD7572